MIAITLGKINGMDALLKIRLTDDEKRVLCGPGTEMLFTAIDETESVRRAAEKTGMSYTKAWKIIHDAESASSRLLVQRNTGGRDGGSAFLTEDARRLISLYREISEKLETAKREIIKGVFL